MELNAQLLALAVSTQWVSLRYWWGSRLKGPPQLIWSCGEEEISCTCQESNFSSSVGSYPSFCTDWHEFILCISILWRPTEITELHAFCILPLDRRWVFNLNLRLIYPWANERKYPLDVWLGGSENRSRNRRGEKFLPLNGIKPRSFSQRSISLLTADIAEYVEILT